jgi:aldose 1-epimerase
VVEYELASHDENELQLHIYANTSASTIVNLTNHAYWNLSGDAKRNIYSHFLHLASHHVLPVDTTQIPTGELKYVVEQPPDNSESGSHTLGNFDFVSEERPRKLNEALLTSIVLDEQDREKGRPGLDHCFVIDGYEPAIEGLTPYAAVADAVANVAVGAGTHKASSPRNANNKRLLAVGTLLEPESGRVLILRSTQPGVQVYTANWLPLAPPSSDVNTNGSDASGSNSPTGSASTKDRLFRMHNAICLETQHFPDSPNYPHFPSTIVRPTAAGKDANDQTGDHNTSTVAVPSNAHHDFYELTVFQFRVLP